MLKKEIIEKLKGKIIVSCQALPDEPLYSPEALLLMAKASINGGAVALRVNSPLSVRQMKHFYSVPIIGLYKKDYPDSEIYITPTSKEAEAVAIAGAEIIATDATLRKRPENEELKNIVTLVQNRYKKLVMADISTFAEGIEAEKMGFDLIGTTLSGYTSYSPQKKEPDFELLTNLIKKVKTPVIMEGRIWEPEQVTEAFARGAWAVVIGSSITRPQLITQRFTKIREN